MKQPKNQQLNFEIDKFTNSIESSLSGESFKTDVRLLQPEDIKSLRKRDWIFDWKKECSDKKKSVYKLVAIEFPVLFHGLISLEDKGDHIFMHLVENIKFNRGSGKLYLGVAGNLIAYACKLSFDKGYDGFVSFESKTKLIAHYQHLLGAKLLFGNMMVIETQAALKLVSHYYP